EGAGGGLLLLDGAGLVLGGGLAEPDRRRRDRGGRGIPRGRVAGGGPHRQTAGARGLARLVGRGPARARASRTAQRRFIAPRDAGPIRPAGAAGDRGAARGPGRASLAGAAAM